MTSLQHLDQIASILGCPAEHLVGPPRVNRPGDPVGELIRASIADETQVHASFQSWVTDDPLADARADADLSALCLASKGADAFDSSAGDNGLLGVRACLEAAICSLQATPGATAAMSRPLLALADALEDLQRGVQHPMLTLLGRTAGRSAYRQDQRNVQAACVLASKALVEMLGMQPAEARQLVVKRAEGLARRAGLVGRRSDDGSQAYLSDERIRQWSKREAKRWRDDGNDFFVATARLRSDVHELKLAGASIETMRERILLLVREDDLRHLSGTQ